MLHLIKANMFRIYKKKSMRYYLIFISLGFIGIHVFMKTQYNDPDLYLMSTQALLGFSTLFIGTYLFSLIYSDDVNSKTDLVSIGLGHKRMTLILSRFVSAVLMVLVVVNLMLLHVLILPRILGYELSHSVCFLLVQQVLLEGFKILVYITLASIVSYWFQSNILATITYFVFTSGIVTSILQLLTNFSVFNNMYVKVSPYLLSRLIIKVQQGIIMDQSITSSIMGIGIYICVFLGISIVVYSKKDLEF